MGGVALGPFVGRGIDNLVPVPWYATLFAILIIILFQSVQTGAGDINVAAVVIATIGLNVFSQMIQVSLTTAVFGYVFVFRHSVSSLSLHLFSRISISARTRLNAVMILSVSSRVVSMNRFLINK